MSTSAAPLVLLIDDNHELTENLVEIFEARGFDTHVATDAAAGLAYARQRGFDLAVVDVKLPDSSGLELLPALRDASPVGEVVLMTGHATIDSAIAAVRGGAFHYVVKPFKAEDLIATAESALRQVTLRRDRAALARRLERSERRYRDVVESSPLVVLALDRQGRVRMANRRTAELTGYVPDALVGQPALTALFPPDVRETVGARIASALARRGPLEFEAPVSCHDGRLRAVRWFAARASDAALDGASEPPVDGADTDTAPRAAQSPTRPAPHDDAGDDDVALYLAGTDVTERLSLERRAAEAEALAQMGTLAAGLAHEIRNPLNAAGLQLHVLGRQVAKLPGDDGAPLRARIGIVASELKRLELLLGDFLELARPRPIAREPVDMAALLSEVIALHEPNATARGVKIQRVITPGSALGDLERLKQVFHNLVLNALEAVEPGETVSVETNRESSDPPALTVTVRDTGRGIAPLALARVFEPFFTTKAAGTGLGLPIVRQIVQRHGGTVEIHSAEGEGTHVRVRLPSLA